MPQLASRLFSYGAACLLSGVLSACGQGQLPAASLAEGNLAGVHQASSGSWNFTLLYSFPRTKTHMPRAADSGLTYFNSSFFGTTYGGGRAYENGGTGTVYELNSNDKLRVLHTFRAAEGAQPQAGLTELNGTLYGTTEFGGSNCQGDECGYGFVFSISPTGSHYKVIHSFQGPDGAFPSTESLIVLNGTLYGTTLAGGTHCKHRATAGCGVVYAITPSKLFKTVYEFLGETDGEQPMGVVALHGMLYGTTVLGGTNMCPYSVGCGTIFSLTTSGQKHTLHDFANGEGGYWPEAGLTVSRGLLYGTASRGGIKASCMYFWSTGCGTVFQVSTSGLFNVLHRFRGLNGDGSTPVAALLARNGTLYGTTNYGPGDDKRLGGYGIVFSITPSGQETILHTFRGAPADGAYPVAPLTSVAGKIYGATPGGGASGDGAIFSLSP